MGRTIKNGNLPHPKPVEKVELSERYVGLRVVLFLVLLVVGVSAIAYGIRSFFGTKEGWTAVGTEMSAGAGAGNEFIFMYRLGSRDDMSVVAENKAVTAAYAKALEHSYQLFHSNQSFENVPNIYYINQHPNQVIKVDDLLYRAFATAAEYEDRNLYLAPVYESYDDIFFCEDDSQIVDYDPCTNEEVAALYREMAVFAGDPESVEVRLLGDNEIQLYVSDDYLKYGRQNDVSKWIDFSWMKNAFIVDFLAEELAAQGFTAGTISSYDGFARNMDDSGETFALNIYNREQEEIRQVAAMQYSLPRSFVTLRDYPMNAPDKYRYYQLDNGQIRTSYLDVADGLCKSAVDSLYSYSTEHGCAQILMEIAPLYIADAMQEPALWELAENGIYSLYCRDHVILYNDASLKLTELYAAEGLIYTAELQK